MPNGILYCLAFFMSICIYSIEVGALVVIPFSYTGSNQMFTVPPGVFLLTIIAKGGSVGTAAFSTSGNRNEIDGGYGAFTGQSKSYYSGKIEFSLKLIVQIWRLNCTFKEIIL